LCESKEVENVLSSRYQILKLKVRPYSDIVCVLQRVACVTRINYYDVILIFIFSDVELRIVIGHHIEEDIIECNIGKEDYSSVLVTSPPRSETVKGFFSFL
jgi:hypothetical protein